MRYCSPECQRSDWPYHKNFCGKQTLKDMAAGMRKMFANEKDRITAEGLREQACEDLQDLIDPDWMPFEDLSPFH